MKIDRRCFLSFVAGGAAGTALSPLPWKLMDDFSIWSQNWPWVPVPTRGESTYADTTCSLCPGGCGITVRKVDNRAIKIEGIKGHPINNGGICSLGLSGLQILYGPTRIKTPMKRVGIRGSGNWQTISWDEAISIVVDRLKVIRSNGNANKVACISGTDNGIVSLLIKRFLQSYGSAKFSVIPSSDEINKRAMNALCGLYSDVSFDFENSDFILSFGNGLADTWSSPVQMARENSKWLDGMAKLVQVESSLSNTAAKSDKWIPINPGTEADLALGIAAFLVKNDLYDLDFVSQKAVDFDSWKKILVTNYSLDSVSRTTGIGINDIVNLSKLFANAVRPISICNYGKGVTLSSFKDYVSINLLNLLIGNINKTGGVFLHDEFNYVHWPTIHFDNIAHDALNLESINEFNEKNDLITDFRSEKIALEALFISNSNPMYTLLDTKATQDFFERIPFIVSFSSFMDETSIEADLILPNHVYLERLEDIPLLSSSGEPMIGLSKPIISAQFNTKHLGETILNIAHKFGGSISKAFPWENYEECFKDTLNDKLENMYNKGFWVADNLEFKELKKFSFNWFDLPSIQAEGNPNLFPLVLVPYNSLRLSSGYISSPPFLVKTVADTVIKDNTGFVDINPHTAEVLGFSENDDAILSTSKGVAKVKVNFYDGVKPGIIMMVRGLGHTAYDGGYIADKGVNVNDLVGPVKDPILGHDAFWGMRAKLTKA